MGQILKPVGLSGAVKICSFTENPKTLFNFSIFLNENSDEIFGIGKIISQKNEFFIVKINGIDSLFKAKQLVGLYLFVCKEEMQRKDDIKDNEFYYSELIGKKVICGNEVIGEIGCMHNFGSCDIMEIFPSGLMIPFSKDSVLEINNFAIIISKEFL